MKAVCWKLIYSVRTKVLTASHTNLIPTGYLPSGGALMNLISGLVFIEQYAFVKHGCPQWQQSQNLVKYLSPTILTLSHPQGHVGDVIEVSATLDELTIQVWLLYHHDNLQNFKYYCTLYVGGTELRSDGQPNKQKNGQTDTQMIKYEVVVPADL